MVFPFTWRLRGLCSLRLRLLVAHQDNSFLRKTHADTMGTFWAEESNAEGGKSFLDGI